MPPAQNPRPTMDALTSLRFFAAMYVLILHSGTSAARKAVDLPVFVSNFLGNGWSGVSLFFVLSGFILVYAYQKRLESAADVKTFFIARFARIYPVYFLAMLISIPIGLSTYMGIWWPQFLCLQTWDFMFPPGEGGPANWNMTAWTISVELFFYLTFPFSFWLMRNLSIAPLCLLIVALVLLIYFTNASYVGTHIKPPLDIFAIVVKHWFEFLLGMCLGLIYLQWRAPDWLWWTPYAVIVVTILVLGSTDDPFVARWATYCYGALIFTIAACMRDGVLKRLLTTEWLYFLGGASYALYITQTPVRYLIGLATDGTVFSTPARLAYIPFMILWSCLLFKFVEEPCRRYINGLGARRKLAPRNA